MATLANRDVSLFRWGAHGIGQSGKLSIGIFNRAKEVETRTDADTGNSFYVNIFTGVRWFSAKDAEGKEYFYEENGEILRSSIANFHSIEPMVSKMLLEKEL